MSDASTLWLLNAINRFAGDNALWFADENVLPVLNTVHRYPASLTIISNRFDVAEEAKKYTSQVIFNDFDCTAMESASLDTIFYRISKEKPLVHHILKTSARLLKPGGRLFLCGEKNEGIKTFIEKTARYFQDNVRATKEGTLYYAAITLQAILTDAAPDDNDYPTLREIRQLNQTPWISKPGLFGWNKIDEGSALLVQHILAEFQHRPAPENILDLGCGYGYLTLMTASIAAKKRVLTDNNAAALLAAKANCDAQHLSADIVAADAGNTISETFDLILCNPPFHQGFGTDGDLTDKFLQQAKRLLSNKGTAFFVVNQFIPLEKKAAHLFGDITLLEKNKGFRIFRLVK